MEFVLKAASRFNELLSSEERTDIEASLNAIADTAVRHESHVLFFAGLFISVPSIWFYLELRRFANRSSVVECRTPHARNAAAALKRLRPRQ